MWCGIPVIAHPTPGLREALGSAGTFCVRDDLEGWVFEIRRLLRADHWRPASNAATRRALQLDMTDDLAQWVHLVESIATHEIARSAA